MFSSDSLIQLAFANEGDTYYCDSLLKLNLNQYLWLNLHEKYDIVYFLSAKDEQLYVDDYGDKDAKKFNYDQSFFQKLWGKGNHAKTFCGWMKEQLTAKNKKCAFVCAIDEFCDVFESDPWKKALTDIANIEKGKGTIILTVPPVIEKSREFLLYSQVFDTLRDPILMSARNGIIQNYYASLKKDKAESCVFLNAFTKERIHAMLLCVVFEEASDRYVSDADLELMSEYLAQYLNNKRLQWTDHLFEKHFNLVNPLYCEIYDQLKHESVWKRLMRIAAAIREAGSIRQYMAEKRIDFTDEEMAAVRISYEKGTSVWKCMALCPDEKNIPEDDWGQNTADMLLEIHHELSMPRNSRENPCVTEAMDSLLLKLNNARSNGDGGTYKRTLYSIHFCVQCIYASDESEEAVRKIIGLLEDYTELSMEVYRARKHVGGISKSQFSVAETVVNKLKAEKTAQETLLRKLDGIIPASIATSIQHSYTSSLKIQDTVSELFDELEQKLNEPAEYETEPIVEPEPEPAAANTTPAEEKEDEEMDIFLTESLFDFRPPTSG